MITDEKIAELRNALGKGTPRLWEPHYHKHINGEFWCSIGHEGRGPLVDIVGAEGNKTEYYTPVAGMKYLVAPVEQQKANAILIVAAVNALSELLDEIEMLRNEQSAGIKLTHVRGNRIAELEAALRDIVDHNHCDDWCSNRFVANAALNKEPTK